jgi:ATP-dependent Clp protease ATP-binding subunit ClpC
MAADAEAKKLQDEFISTEHIFIAIVGEGSGESYSILHRLGLDKEKVYGALQKVRGGHRVTDARAESKYRSLEKYGYDLTEMAREGKLDPIIGREKEIERVVRILCRLNNNNPLIYGPRNVGKTSIVCGLAQKIVAGETKDILKLKKIIALDIGTALAGTKFRGEFEERLKAIMDEVRESKGEIVLFISDLHLLKGYGLAEGGSDLTKIINPYLRHHEIQCIATASTNDNKLIVTEISPELFELFTFTPINEISLEDTLRVLKALKPKYEVHYNVNISDDAIKSAVTLSKKYIKNGCFPQKAMNLLDEAASKVRFGYFQKDNTNPTKLGNSSQSDNYLMVRSENIIDTISELEGIPKTTIIGNDGS